MRELSNLFSGISFISPFFLFCTFFRLAYIITGGSNPIHQFRTGKKCLTRGNCNNHNYGDLFFKKEKPNTRPLNYYNIFLPALKISPPLSPNPNHVVTCWELTDRFNSFEFRVLRDFTCHLFRFFVSPCAPLLNVCVCGCLCESVCV